MCQCRSENADIADVTAAAGAVGTTSAEETYNTHSLSLPGSIQFNAIELKS